MADVMRGPSQNDRVLLLLKQRAQHGRGLSTVEMLRIPTADGGKPITRLAARVKDLQDQGHQVRSERRFDGTATYHLAEVIEQTPEPVAGVSTGGLFDAFEFDQRPAGAYEAT